MSNELIREMVEALEANHQWHQDYDDYDGYPDSALENENSAALAKARAYLASGGLAWNLRQRIAERIGHANHKTAMGTRLQRIAKLRRVWPLPDSSSCSVL